MIHSLYTSSRSTFILALWSLLFTKCFTLEYLVRHYEAPINSLSYVWALSIIMACVATVVYANIQAEVRTKLLKHPNFLVILTLALFIVILVAKSLLAEGGVSRSLALAATGTLHHTIIDTRQRPKTAINRHLHKLVSSLR
jgi:signal transduction histidine kinase